MFFSSPQKRHLKTLSRVRRTICRQDDAALREASSADLRGRPLAILRKALPALVSGFSTASIESLWRHLLSNAPSDFVFPPDARPILEAFAEIMILDFFSVGRISKEAVLSDLWDSAQETEDAGRETKLPSTADAHHEMMADAAGTLCDRFHTFCRAFGYRDATDNQARFLALMEEREPEYTGEKPLIAEGDASPKGTILWDGSKAVSIALTGYPLPDVILMCMTALADSLSSTKGLIESILSGHDSCPSQLERHQRD